MPDPQVPGDEVPEGDIPDTAADWESVPEEGVTTGGSATRSAADSAASGTKAAGDAGAGDADDLASSDSSEAELVWPAEDDTVSLSEGEGAHAGGMVSGSLAGESGVADPTSANPPDLNPPDLESASGEPSDGVGQPDAGAPAPSTETNDTGPVSRVEPSNTQSGTEQPIEQPTDQTTDQTTDQPQPTQTGAKARTPENHSWDEATSTGSDNGSTNATGPVFRLEADHVPAETPAERTQSIRPIREADPTERRSIDDTQRIEAIPAAERTDPGQRQPEHLTEQTTRFSPISAESTSVDPSSAPEPSVSDSERTQRISRPEIAETASADQRSARPEDFGLFGSQRDEHSESARAAAGDDTAAGRDAQTGTSAARSAEGAPDPTPRERGRRPYLIATAVAAVVLLGLGVAFIPGMVGGGATAPPPDPVRLSPAVKPADGGDAPMPTQQGIEATLSNQLSNPALGEFAGTVLDAETGETVWQREPGRSLVPGSTVKLLTAGAALLTLDPEDRFTTKVVRGDEPGSVVLVGGGDPTLSKLPTGRESVYDGAAHLAELTSQVRASTGGDVREVRVDSDRYPGDPMAPGWESADIAEGYIAPIDPVMLDGGRADPTEDVSRRSQQPAMQAGQAFGSEFGTHGLDVTEGTAPEDAEVLGEVHSPTVRELVQNMLRDSDNVLAETLAREVAVAEGNEPSFGGATASVHQVLREHGFNLGGSNLADGSGLSTDNRLAPEALGEIMRAANAPADQQGATSPETAKLRGMLPGLPVAGGSGSLDDRYLDNGGRGWVRAKTGTLDDVNSLAGSVLSQDGRLLVFGLMSNGTSSTQARPALDEVAAGLRECGCR